MTDHVISNNLVVFGMSTFAGGQTFDGQMIVDLDNTEALLVRKDGDGGDVFIVDTVNDVVSIGSGIALFGTPADRLIITAPDLTVDGTFGASHAILMVGKARESDSTNHDSNWRVFVDPFHFPPNDGQSDLKITAAIDGAIPTEIVKMTDEGRFAIIRPEQVSIGSGSFIDNVQVHITGSFIDDYGGGPTTTHKLLINGSQTGDAGRTLRQTTVDIDAQIFTQNNSETIDEVGSMFVDAPTIVTGTDTITKAYTLKVNNTPNVAGSENYGLLVDSSTSASNLTALVRIGKSFNQGIKLLVGGGVGFENIEGTAQMRLTNFYTPDGLQTEAMLLHVHSTLQATDGTTDHITGAFFEGTLRTQVEADENVANISQVRIDEPNIQDNLTGTGEITNAQSLLITGAPTEGESNFALRVASGLSQFGGTVQIADTQAPALLNEVGSATNPTVIPNRTFLDAGFAVIDDEGSQIIELVVEGTNVMNLGLARANFNLTNLFEINGGLFVDGNSNVIQMAIDAHSTQTQELLRIRDSSAAVIMTVADSGDTLIGGDLTVSGAGPHAIGGTPQNNQQLRLTGNFVSGGVSLFASNLHMDTDLTGFTGDTSFLAGFSYAGAITTQASLQTITNVSSMQLDEPDITIAGGFAMITNAQTLLILAAPTEGLSNFALRVVSGLSQFGGTIQAALAGGPAFLNETAADDNPTLIPRRADITTGIAGADAEGNSTLTLVVEASKKLEVFDNNATWRSLTSGMNFLTHVFIDGVADTEQLKVQGHSTQNANIFVVEQSDGTDIFTIDNDGDTLIAGALNHDGSTVGFFGVTPAVKASFFTRTATIVESKTLAANASASAQNNNAVLAALIADLQAYGLLDD